MDPQQLLPSDLVPEHGVFCHWWHFFTAVALSGAAGIRATLPVFLISLLHQIEPDRFPISPQASWLQSPQVCALLGIALLVEILADQIPVVDHALHTVLAPVHPAMGAAVAMAPNYCGGLMTRVPMALLGGGLAGMVHSGKAVVRAGSTGSSGGVLNPAVSHCENFAALALVVCSILSPLFAMGAAIFMVVAGCLGFKWALQAMSLPDDDAAQSLPPDGKRGRRDGSKPFLQASAPDLDDLEHNGDDLEDNYNKATQQPERQRLLALEQGDIAKHEIDRILAAPNLHWVLGGGSSAETRQEYRRLLRLLHPDRGHCSGHRASLALQRVVEAHGVLHGGS